eukprot:TRINITY_DN2693_c0_g2_i1.p2 TRINITY_DN2693_c0_g2~~TRINITY_DN2693_c0_g2_i1.p2  ORF type:complete len:379 (+),score=112.06 TRINITY_DN2693_c0_g2_i1:93-1229(+)
MSAQGDTIAEQEAEFQTMLFDIERHYIVLPKPERIRVEQWVKKLCEPVPNKQWAKNRNQHAELLLHMVKQKRLEEPYHKLPYGGPLNTLGSWMLADVNRAKKKTKQQTPARPSEDANTAKPMFHSPSDIPPPLFSKSGGAGVGPSLSPLRQSRGVAARPASASAAPVARRKQQQQQQQQQQSLYIDNQIMAALSAAPAPSSAAKPSLLGGSSDEAGAANWRKQFQAERAENQRLQMQLEQERAHSAELQQRLQQVEAALKESEVRATNADKRAAQLLLRSSQSQQLQQLSEPSDILTKLQKAESSARIATEQLEGERNSAEVQLKQLRAQHAAELAALRTRVMELEANQKRADDNDISDEEFAQYIENFEIPTRPSYL